MFLRWGMWISAWDPVQVFMGEMRSFASFKVLRSRMFPFAVLSPATFEQYCRATFGQCCRLDARARLESIGGTWLDTTSGRRNRPTQRCSISDAVNVVRAGLSVLGLVLKVSSKPLVAIARGATTKSLFGYESAVLQKGYVCRC